MREKGVGKKLFPPLLTTTDFITEDGSVKQKQNNCKCGELQCRSFDGVAKSPTYCVTAFFQDLDIPYVCLHP